MKVYKKITLKGHQSGIYTLLKFNDQQFISGSGDGKIVSWNINDFGNGELIATTPSPVYSLAFNTKQNQILAGTHKGQLHVVDLNAKKEVRCFDLHEHGIFEINYLEEKDLLITGGGDGKLKILDTGNFELKASIEFGNFKMRCTVYDKTRNSLLAGCGNGTIAVVNFSSFKVEQIIDAHKKDFSVNALCISPDGNFVLSGSRDAHLNVFDIKNNYHLVTSLPAHNYAIYKIAFSPDGKYFATASRDKTCKIWDANTMEVVARLDHEKLEGHVNSVNTLLWMNNNLLITAGDDRAIICWELS